MKNEHMSINKINLEYNMTKKAISNHFEGKYEGLEIPSVHYLNLKYDDEIYIPITLFQSECTPLQIIIKYLREDLKKSNKQTAILLNRDPKTIWYTYKSVEKRKKPLLDEIDIWVPLRVFSDRRLSAFEALVNFLRSLDMKYSDIARLIKRDQRTIWTVYSRVKNKLKKNENKE